MLNTKEMGAHQTPPVNQMHPTPNDYSDFTAEQLALPPFTFMSGDGQFHTNEPTAKNQKPYIPMTLAEVGQMIETPPSIEKSKARWVIFSTLLTREFAAQLNSGQFVALWCDFDQDPKPLDEVVTAWCEIAGQSVAWFYTTRSATAEMPKSRLIVPLATPVDGKTFILAQEVLNDLFEQKGFKTDRASQRAGQLCYLPNSGKFYDWRKRSGKLFDVEAFGSDLSLKNAQHMLAKIERDLSRQATTQRRQTRLEERQREGGGISAIDWFNETQSLDEILGLACYDSDPSHADKYRHPHSESGNFSARVWRDCDTERVSTLSPNDPLFRSTGDAHDAFSAWCILEHGGDEKAALHEARRQQNAADFDVVDLNAHTNVGFTEGARKVADDETRLIVKPEFHDAAVMLEIEPFKGVMTDLVNSIVESAHKQQPMLSVAAALAGMAAGVRGLYSLPDGGRMNLYVIGLSASGTGKDHPRRCAEAIAAEVGASIQGQLVSSAGLEDALPTGDPSDGMLLALDEVGDFIGAVNNTNAPIYMKQLHGTLLKLFSASNSTFYGRPLAGKKGQRYLHPTVSLFGLTTEEGLGDDLPMAAIEKGLLGRVLMVRGRDHEPMQMPAKPFAMPESLRKTRYEFECIFSKYCNQIKSAREDAIQVQFSNDAKPYYQDLMNGFETPNAEPLMATLQRRSFEKCGRIAGTLAVWDNPREPIIEREHLDWARRFVEVSNHTLLQFVRDKMHGDKVQANAARLKQVIVAITNGHYTPDKGNELAAVQKQLAPKSLTLRRSKLNADDFEKAMRHLIEANVVVREQFKTHEMLKAMTVYRLAGAEI